MAALTIENLCKTYRNGVKALEGLTFSVQEGEIFGLLGPNGAGKSTTVRILATLTQADSGKAEVAGADVFSQPALVRSRIGYVAQASGVDKWATGKENLTLQAHLQRVPSAEIEAKVTRVLQWVNLTEASTRIVKTYSGGMKRRLDLAMGLVHEPKVLFLDEPTTGLDPETRAALWNDLERLRKEKGITVLLTTHYLEEADRLCDRLAIVDQGRIVVEGEPNALKAQIRGDAITLELESPMDAAVKTLADLECVLEAKVEGHSVIARVTQGATALPQIITALERHSMGVKSAALSRPTLDDVYLHHTGHRLEVK